MLGCLVVAHTRLHPCGIGRPTPERPARHRQVKGHHCRPASPAHHQGVRAPAIARLTSRRSDWGPRAARAHGWHPLCRGPWSRSQRCVRGRECLSADTYAAESQRGPPLRSGSELAFSQPSSGCPDGAQDAYLFFDSGSGKNPGPPIGRRPTMKGKSVVLFWCAPCPGGCNHGIIYPL